MNNLSIIVQALGGLGLFLLGMIVMTDGLRALAGNTVRSALMRFTRSPLSGAVTGAVSTAVLQSSSATTVAAVGFVGAGLMRFPRALGIIFGANIGTTFKGWIIVLLGFKFPLGTLLLPVIFIGAIMRLFGNGRLAQAGFALAGFGLIFVGISTLQLGMGGLAEIISPADLPADTLVGRLELVALGIITTIITQSSSAGVAAALTALYAGAISFEQAAALVIGMDIGTTVTAAIATIGGTVGSRRTGYSHVIYNLFTGIGALLLISPYIFFWEMLAPERLLEHAEVALVAFHSLFNTLGVVLVLPFTSRFARMIEKMVPDKLPVYAQKLDRSLLQQPVLALNSVFHSIEDEFKTLLRHISFMLGDKHNGSCATLPELQKALDNTHEYLDQIHLKKSDDADWERLVALIHTLDHMQRLHERCEEEEGRASTARENPALSNIRDRVAETANEVFVLFSSQRWHDAEHLADKTAGLLEEEAELLRHEIMKKVASGVMDIPASTESLEAVRWLRRVSKHIARITRHYEAALLATGK